MTLYVVRRDDGDYFASWTILGIYDSHEKAESRMNTAKNVYTHGLWDFDILECELNADIEER